MEAWSGAQAVAGLFYPSLRSPDKKLREAVGLTQEVFAISPGSSPGLPSVKRWELGTAKPGRLALARLEEFRRRGEMSTEEADEALIK